MPIGRLGGTFRLVLAVAAVLLLCTCSGGNDGGTSGQPSANSGGNPDPNPPPAPTPPPVVTPPPSVPSLPETVLTFSGTPEQTPSPILPALKSSLLALAIAHDNTRNQLIASAILDDGKSAVVGLNPADLSQVWAVGISSPPTVLAISDDGSMLYAGLFFESAVQQIDLRTRSTVRTFALAAPDSGLGAFDIAVRPGSPETVAISVGDVILIPTFRGLALYVQGVKQPKEASAGPFGRASQIEFLDSSTLLGFDNETTSFSIQKYSVADDGLTDGPFALSGCCFGFGLTVTNGRVFLASGTFVDPATLKDIKALGRGVSEMKMFHPSANSVVQVFVDPETGTPMSIQLLIEEYDVDRGYLKRRFRVDETIPGLSSIFGVAAQVLAAVPTGPSSFALLVADAITGLTAILAYDLAAIPPLSSRTFFAEAAASVDVNALSIPLPVSSYVYDPVGDRIVATVPPSLGPQGNSLAIIRASDGTIERFVPLSSEPRNLSISQSGGIAYVNLPFESSLQQVDLNTGTLGLKTRIEFPTILPQNLTTINGFSSESIAVKPDDPLTVAIAGCGGNGYDCNTTVAVFRNGAQIGLHGPISQFPDGSRPFSSVVAFNGPTEILGLDLFTTNASIQRFSLTDSGFLPVSSTSFLLDLDTTTKVGSGFAYDRYALVDLQANQRVGKFVPGSSDFPFFDQTLLLSPISGVGYHREFPGVLYELLPRAVKSDGSLEFSGQSRIRIDDPRFQNGFPGLMAPAGTKRFAHSFTKFADGTGVIYLVSIP